MNDRKYKIIMAYEVIAPSASSAISFALETEPDKMTVEVIEREWFFMEDNDYHLHRWRDGLYGLCNKDAMLQNSKIVLRRGPVILARTKKFGAKEEDMFSRDTLYGKKIEAIQAPHLTNNPGALVTTRVFITVDGERKELPKGTILHEKFILMD